MIENDDSVKQLLEKLSGLMKRQEEFHQELEDLRHEINKMQSQKAAPGSEPVIIKQPE